MRQAWLDKLAVTRPSVALADGDDPRAREAARTLAALGIVRPILVVHGTPPHEPGIETVSAGGDDPLTVAARMVSGGTVDCGVGGATRPSADVIRAGLREIGPATDGAYISSSFLMGLADGRDLLYADCGVIPEPNAAQLAEIAVVSAATHRQLTDTEPLVAMLSFSTHGSADHPTSRIVAEATQLARGLDKNLVIDGELQFDAAFSPEVARVKAPDSSVAGRANVFIFPNLSAANIAYKITERLAGASAAGPLLQGLARPFHDLSRGCSPSDIATVATIAALQSIAEPVRPN